MIAIYFVCASVNCLLDERYTRAVKHDSVVMFRQQRRFIRGGCIVKPPRAPERYVRVDVDLRHMIGSSGAQSHVQEQSGGASANTHASAASSGNGQIVRPIELPVIDEVTDVRRLDQHMYDRYSTRILMQNRAASCASLQ